MCETKNVLTFVFGPSGSGKSTLARNILFSNGGEIETVKFGDSGYCTVCNNSISNNNTSSVNINNNINKYIIALGKYSTNCGGVDSLKTLKGACQLAYDVSALYPNANILFESLLMSGLVTTPLKFILSMKYERGFNVDVCFLYAQASVLIRRVLKRNNGKGIKSSIIQAKLEGGARLFDKISKLGEFRCKAIDTTNLDDEQVFDQFRNWSSMYKG